MNPWKQFNELIAPGAKAIVTVELVNGDGTVTVSLASGASIKVSGDNVSVGDKVIIQAERIIGKAPALPVVRIVV